MNTFDSYSTLKIDSKKFGFYSLRALANLHRLPFSIRILLENLLRNEDGRNVTKEDILALANWQPNPGTARKEIAFTPARVILQDFTGVPCVVDLAAMRDYMAKNGGDPKKINPLQPVDLVIDHSVQVDFFGTSDAFRQNTAIEFERNLERYQFLRWGQKAFRNFRVVPPGTGIVHQVNLEYLAQVVMTSSVTLCPDTLVGTDSHTTMINGLGVLGWGVGGIEAEAAMLGQPISMLIPDVVGFKFYGKLKEGVTATDLVLTVTQMLRKKGVVGKFVEFFGPGLDELSLADRATVANMAPEYGATMGFFPVDNETLNYLKLSGRSPSQIRLVETYLKAQHLFRTSKTPDPIFSDTLKLDLGSVEASLAGPKRPQDRVTLKDVKSGFKEVLPSMLQKSSPHPNPLPQAGEGKTSSKYPLPLGEGRVRVTHAKESFEIGHGSVVIAAITSCTNTSNPSVMIGAGILAKKAVARGLSVKPWVKSSLAPGSKVVVDYLKKAGVLKDLEKLKFNLVGYGCTTCIGNSGPLPEAIAGAIKKNDFVAAAVLSGNRNFEGRVNPHVRANYLASPPLVVAYAIAGTIDTDLVKDPMGKDSKGNPVYLAEIWPTEKEIRAALKSVQAGMFKKQYAGVFKGDRSWKSMKVSSGDIFSWDDKSTYVKHPPYFKNMPKVPAPVQNIENARVLVMVGDSVTTDHISPAGSIQKDGPAGKYLMANGVQPKDFNSYGARRGNHEVMVRGTFANIRLKNLLASGTEGGWTRYFPLTPTLSPEGRGQGEGAEVVSIFDAAMKYKEKNVPLLVIAGKEYGAGSSRDWAAKGPALLGVKAVIAESYERIHRSNLIGMGILPLQFKEGENPKTLGLTGEEIFFIDVIGAGLRPNQTIQCRAAGHSGEIKFQVISRIDTPVEVSYYQHGGILQYVLRQLCG